MNFDVHAPTVHVLLVDDRLIGAYLLFVDFPYITPIALAFIAYAALTPGTRVKRQQFGSLVELSGRSRSL
jgi:hypothetical protein